MHLAYPAPEGDAFYTEMTVEKSADGTYFMAAGWSKGYFGIQELASGKKLVLFSVWDPTSGSNAKGVDETKRVQMLSTRTRRCAMRALAAKAPADSLSSITNGRLLGVYRFLVTREAPGGRCRLAYSGCVSPCLGPRNGTHTVVAVPATITNGTLLKELLFDFVEDFTQEPERKPGKSDAPTLGVG